MNSSIRRESCRFHCPEEDREANLIIEWRKADGDEVIHSVRCDNPKLADLDNWDCRWTCMEALEKKLKVK